MKKLVLKNISRRRSSSCITILICALTIFLFVLLLTSFNPINSGLKLTTSRLGADIIVLPNQTNADSYDTIFSAAPQNVYMSESIIDQLSEIEGIDKISPQFFTQTLDAGCCSFGEELKLIGYDPKTDFLLAPWLEQENLSVDTESQIIAGANIPASPGEGFILLGQVFKLAGKLYETGSSMDNTLFISLESAGKLAKSNENLKHFFTQINADTAVSAILIKVTDGADSQAIANAIAAKNQEITATTTGTLIQTTKDKVLAIEKVLFMLFLAALILGGIALWVRFDALVTGRTKEIGLMSALGFPKSKIMLSILAETSLLALLGGVIGSFLGIVASFPMLNFLKELFNLAVGIISIQQIFISFFLGLALSVLMGIFASIYSCYQKASIEPMKAIEKGGLA